MKQFHFLVQGSASQPYSVTVKSSLNKLNIYCTCPAGSLGQNCKHKIQIMQGGQAKVISNNLDELGIIPDLVNQSPISDAMKRLSDLESEAHTLKLEISSTKKQIASLLSD